MAQYFCQIIGPPPFIPKGPRVKVEARGYESAARVHVGADGPRTALSHGEVHVRVKRVFSEVPSRVIKVSVYLHAETLVHWRFNEDE